MTSLSLTHTHSPRVGAVVPAGVKRVGACGIDHSGGGATKRPATHAPSGGLFDRLAGQLSPHLEYISRRFQRSRQITHVSNHPPRQDTHHTLLFHPPFLPSDVDRGANDACRKRPPARPGIDQPLWSAISLNSVTVATDVGNGSYLTLACAHAASE